MIRAAFETSKGWTVMIGLTDVNMQRIASGGDEGLGRPIKVPASDLLPSAAASTPISNVEVVVFYASRESILALAEMFGQDPKGLLDQLGEG